MANPLHSLVCCALGAAALGAQSDVIELNPSLDTKVLESNPNASFGSGGRLPAFRRTDSNRDGLEHSLMKFDLSGVRRNLVSATLELTMDGPQHGDSSMSAYRVTEAWDASVTWNTQPAYAERVFGVGLNPGNRQVRQWNVTNLVRQWLDGTSPNHGLFYIGRSDDPFWIHSSESTTPPRLILEVDGPSAFTPSIDISISGNSPNSSYGNGTRLPLYWVRGGSYESGLMRFDLSDLSGIVASAHLEFMADVTRGGDATMAAYRVTDPWDQTVTWNTRPAYAERVFGAGFNRGNNHSARVDVTNVVRQWVYGTHPNHGFYFLNRSDDRFVVHSSESANPPRLLIELEEPPCFEPELGTPLVMTNESLVTGLDLGFDFPMPGGGTTRTIDVCDNGYFWLDSGNPGNIVSNQPGSGWLANEPTRICPFWIDLTFDGIGDDVYFNALDGRAVITWNRALEANPVQVTPVPRMFTVQCQIMADGRIQFAYSGAMPNAGLALVGWSAGNGVTAQPWLDFSVGGWDTGSEPSADEMFVTGVLPLDLNDVVIVGTPNGQGGYLGTVVNERCAPSSVVYYGSGCDASGANVYPLAISTDDLPVVGRSFTIEHRALPGATPLGILLGITQVSVSLDPFAGGCTLLSSGEAVVPTPSLLGGAYSELAIPNDAGLIGSTIALQAVAHDPGANAMGLLFSNGMAITVGEF